MKQSDKQKSLEEIYPTLNIPLGLKHCMNDKSFFLEMVALYVKDDKREVLEKEFQDGNWNSYMVHVHGLKNTSLSIGAETLSEDMKKLEFAARENDYTYIREHHEEVLAEYSSLIAEISLSQ